MSNPQSDRHEPDISREEAARWRRALDAEADALDAVTLARLSAARHRALALRPRASSGLGWMAWAGSAAMAAVLVTVLLVRDGDALGDRGASRSTSTPMASAAVVDSDVAVISDLEFYDWLEQQDAVL